MSYYRLWTNTYDLTGRVREAKNERLGAGSGRGPTWLNCTIKKYSKQPHPRLHHGVLPVSHWEGSAPLSACQYHVQLWAPQYEKDGDKLEGVQERWPRHRAQATQLTNVFVQSEEQKMKARSYCCLQLPNGTSQGRWNQTSHKHTPKLWEQTQVIKKTPIWYYYNDFNHECDWTLEEGPIKATECPPAERINNSTAYCPEEPHLPLKLALLWVGSWTRRPTETPSN